LERRPEIRLTHVYFSMFPSAYSLGPSVTVERLASRLSQRIGNGSIQILTLNYDEGIRRRLFDAAERTDVSGNLSIKYLPRGIRKYFQLFKILRAPHGTLVIHCLFDYRLALPAMMIERFLFRSKRKIFHFPHGIFLDAVFSQKRLKKVALCGLLDLVGISNFIVHVASSFQEAEDIRRAFRTPQEIVVRPHFGQLPDAVAHAQLAPKKSGEVRICFAGRVARQKNLLEGIEILSAVRVPCEYDIYGVVEDRTYYEECLAKIAELPKHVTVRFLGLIPPHELKARLPSYHLFFFPTLGENFGHAILDALACGVPALISDRTPWNDLEKFGAGWAFKLDNHQKFVEIIEKVYWAGSEYSREGAIAYATAAANPPGLEEAFLKLFNLSGERETTV